MNQNEINAAIRDIMAQGYSLKDVETSYNFLISTRAEVIPHIVSALRECADGNGEGRWWDGTDKLCKVLSILKTDNAKEALLTILKTDSRIAEFDRVRHQAAKELANCDDPKIIPDLLAASKTPHAPILSIKKAIESLGGEMPIDPPVILAEVSNMPMEERIEHFRKYREIVKKWPAFQQRSYYWWIGIGVANSKGEQAALPFFAASLKAAPAHDAAAWSRFSDVSPSQQKALELAKKYPLPNSADKSPRQKDAGKAEKKWWQFWK